MSDIFNQLMQRYDMGQAYKRITSEMGPSPQLVAFVNYDSLSDDGVALESFDSISAHQRILQDIEVDTSYEMAMESLSSKLAQFVGGAYIGVGGGLAIKNYNKFYYPSLKNIGVFPIAMIFAGALLVVSGISQEIVITTKRFDQLKRNFDVSTNVANLFASSIPTTTDEKAWESFHANFVKNHEVRTFLEKAKGLLVGEVERRTGVSVSEKKEGSALFANSGWDKEHFVSAAKWLVDSSDKAKKLDDKIAEKLSSISKIIDQSKEDLGKTPKYINDTFSVVNHASKNSREILKESETALTKVSKHFKAEEK